MQTINNVQIDEGAIKAPEVVKTSNSNQDIINALKASFATTVNRIFINSMNRDVGFREITVLEQKQFTRIMVDNEQRKDVVYDTECALINKVCLEDDFNIYDATEFDKIKLMMALYQNNMFKNEMKFTCPDCGTENTYKLDFQAVFDKLDKFDISDKNYTFENNNWKFEFVIGYPLVKKVSQFYKSFALKYRTASYKEIESMNNQINVDYTTTFIKNCKLTSKTSGASQEIPFSSFTSKQVEDAMALFPQDVMYSDNGILNFITDKFIKRINEQFEKHVCSNCGSVAVDAVDQDAPSFL